MDQIERNFRLAKANKCIADATRSVFEAELIKLDHGTMKDVFEVQRLLNKLGMMLEREMEKTIDELRRSQDSSL